jgi:hypothetical protein
MAPIFFSILLCGDHFPLGFTPHRAFVDLKDRAMNSKRKMMSLIFWFVVLVLVPVRATASPEGAVDEIEPNNSSGQAQILAAIGREHYVNAAINSGGDQDWYQFSAEAGVTYVIELFEVGASLNTISGSQCGHGSDYGVGLRLYDDSGTEITYSCAPNYYDSGSANVHNILAFTPGLAGTYFIKVIPNHENLNGYYSLRVLPQYDQPGASWDTKFEPNNTPATAQLLPPSQTLTTDIETRLTNYATNFVDRDWYRLEAIAGETYRIETVNVSSSLTTSSGKLCQGSTKIGLGIRLYDPTLSTILAYQCSANGTGNVHTSLTFVPDISGTYYIWILPNSSTVSGSYSLRFAGVETVYLPTIRR